MLFSSTVFWRGCSDSALSCAPTISFHSRRGNDLLIEKTDVHSEPPVGARHHPGAGGKFIRYAIYGGKSLPVNDAINLAILPHPIEMAVFLADAFRADLLVGRQPSEMPIDIIRRTNGLSHKDHARALYNNCPIPTFTLPIKSCRRLKQCSQPKQTKQPGQDCNRQRGCQRAAKTVYSQPL